MRNPVVKLFQRQFLNILSTKYGIIFILVITVSLIFALLNFGQVALKFYNSNLIKDVFKNDLSWPCSHPPVDVVYTWVNGSDEMLSRQLAEYRSQLKLKLSNSLSKSVVDVLDSCKFSDCVASNLVSVRFSNDSTTLLSFSNHVAARSSINEQGMADFRGELLPASLCFFTSRDTETLPLASTVIMSDKVQTQSELLTSVNGVLDDDLIGESQILMYPDKSMAIVKLPSSVDIAKFKVPDVPHKIAYLITNLTQLTLDTADASDTAVNRFADNEELRYSLRSLDRNAPWIRHVYLVTNGQVPVWLDTNCPWITVVQHKEIFGDPSHLPTFSSPAIESRLHRIPGLSSRFLYLNDDVLFNSPVSLDDFFTQSRGLKIYLTWPLPNCEDGCPTTWLGDNFCDRPCNNSQCNWDGGDCLPNATNNNPEQVHTLQLQHDRDVSKEYCNNGCSNLWVADRYCDPSCNVKSCGYDAGDCGSKDLKYLHQILLKSTKHKYTLYDGVKVAVLNISGICNEGCAIESAFKNDHDCIRVVAIARPLMVMTILLHDETNTTDLSFQLTFRNNTINQYNFTLTVNTLTQTNVSNPMYPLISGLLSYDNSITMEQTTSPPRLISPFVTYAFDKPKMIKIIPSSVKITEEQYNATLLKLEAQFLNGELTEKGFHVEKHKALCSYNSDCINLNQSRPNHDVPSRINGSGIDSTTNLTSTSDLQPARNSSSHFDAVPPRTLTSSRRLLDTFKDSLHYVNQIYTDIYGNEARKVPAHMPHFIDKSILETLHKKFPAQWEQTTSHRVRQSNDMQFAFSYNYFVIGERSNISMTTLFDNLDTDQSGALSDGELRTFISRVRNLPLHLGSISDIEKLFIACGENYTDSSEIEASKKEQYYEVNMPQITRKLFLTCPTIAVEFRKAQTDQPTYKHEIMNSDDVIFKMLLNNASQVVDQLDYIRRNPKKFICLNDNIAGDQSEAGIVRSVLKDFYSSLFPRPSKYELPEDVRNKFLYQDDIVEWKRKMKNSHRVKMCIVVMFVAMLVAMYYSRWMVKLKYFIFRGRYSVHCV